jgi:hypothetical protein
MQWLPSVLVVAVAAVEPPTVDFARDVRPILQTHCAACHAGGRSKGDFSLQSRGDMLAHPEAVIPGDSGASLLLQLVRGDDPEWFMPPKGPRLDADEIEILRRWIDDGAPRFPPAMPRTRSIDSSRRTPRRSASSPRPSSTIVPSRVGRRSTSSASHPLPGPSRRS